MVARQLDRNGLGMDGRGEPTSWQMGRLIPATDAQLWFDVYGPLHEEAERLFEARLAQQQEQALRERAALLALRGQASAGKRCAEAIRARGAR